MSKILIVGPYPLYRHSLALLLRQLVPEVQIQEADSIEQLPTAELDSARMIICCCHSNSSTGVDLPLAKAGERTQLRVLLCERLGKAQRQLLLQHQLDLILPMRVDMNVAAELLQQLLKADPDPWLGLNTLQDPRFSDSFLPTVDDLTCREQQLLQHLRAGLSNAAIAEKMRVTIHTVKVHISHICRKTGVSNRTQAISLYG